MKKILCAIMSLVMFVACISEEPKSSVQTGGDVSTTPSITLDQTSLSFDEYSDTQLITFYSAMDWTAELINDRADGWCSISPTSGSAGNGEVRVSVNENTTTDDRTASVVIKSGSISRTVRLSQKQRNALTVTTSTFEVESIGGKIYIEVKANVDFEYTINGSAAEWITPIETRAMKTTTLGFNVADNNTFKKREGTITIYGESFHETITVYQKNLDNAILLSQDEYIVSDTGEDIAVEVTSNVDVEIEMPDVDWITRNVSRAASTNTYYFTIAENTTPDQREAYIIFKNTENSISERVKIIQIQRNAIVLAKSVYEIELNGGELDFDIKTNVNIDVTISEDANSWITQVQSRALKTNSLFFDIAAYDGNNSREGTITIRGENVSQIITVRQLIWQDLSDNKIYYTSSDGNVVEPNQDASWGGASIISNNYENGQGVIIFSQILTNIGDNAFSSCNTLTSINIPNSVKTIDAWAFHNCDNLTEVNFGRGLEIIGNYSFHSCSALTSITIPDNVKTIQNNAFSTCENLAYIDLGNGVQCIGGQAFGWCKALKSVTIPQSVVTMNGNPFPGCNEIEAFYGKFASENNNALIVNNEMITIAAANYANLTEYTIPNGITKIANWAFQGSDNIQTINIPDGVIEIGFAAFEGCNNLQTVNIPESVTTITWTAFEHCVNLRNINIPEGVTEIPSYAFSQCLNLEQINLPNNLKIIHNDAFSYTGLIEVTIPEHVTHIGDYAFAYCYNLSRVYIKPTIPPVYLINGTISTVFTNIANNRILYVPRESVDAYKTAPGWSDYANAIVGYDF